MKSDLKYLLCEKTKPIWNSFKSKYKIKLIPIGYYAINIIEHKYLRHKVKIYYDSLELRSDYFAHELLHIKIHKDGFVLSKLIDKLFWDYPFVRNLWDRNIRNIIGNIIEHEKMYPEYCQLGFEPYEFVGDFQEKKCSSSEINNEMMFGLHPSEKSLKYITVKYFLIKGTLDPTINYENELKLLKEFSPDLIFTLDSFWNDIVKMNSPYDKEKQETLIIDLMTDLDLIYKKILS